jgi:hypothetical protein
MPISNCNWNRNLHFTSRLRFLHKRNVKFDSKNRCSASSSCLSTLLFSPLNKVIKFFHPITYTKIKKSREIAMRWCWLAQRTRRNAQQKFAFVVRAHGEQGESIETSHVPLCSALARSERCTRKLCFGSFETGAAWPFTKAFEDLW